MKKKLLIVGGIAVVIIAVITAIIIYTRQPQNTNGITKYEWVQMLTEQFMIEEYKSETPYYKDVAADNQYFRYVQAAYEWEIIGEDALFHGEDIIDGEFVALTIMRAIGKYKIQIYLEMPNEPGDKDYLKLALSETLITKDQLRRGISVEEAKTILEKAKQFYLSTFWKDDYVKIQYRNGVKELEGKAILDVNTDGTEVTVLPKVADTLSNGDIIVFTYPATGAKQAKAVKGISGEGKVAIEEISLDEVINSLTISDIASVSADDMFSQISAEQVNAVINTSVLEQYSVIPVWNKQTSGHSNGLSVSIEASDEEVSVKIVNNDTGAVCEIPVEETLPEGSEISAIVNVPRIDAGVEVCYDLGGLEYVNAQIESDITYNGIINVNAEKEIPIGEVSILLANGMATIDLQLSLKFSIDGTITLQADIPVQFTVDYTKDIGVRSFADVQVYPEIVADCSAECGLVFGPGIALFGYDIFNIETGIGVAVDAEIMNRLNSHVTCCAELSVAAPIVNLAVEFNNDISEIIDGFSEALDTEIPLEWDFFTKDNAPFRKKLHYEWYSDNTLALVEECTYTENESDDRLDYMVRIYGANFETEFVDEGDYYSTIGKVYHNVYIPDDIVANLSVGDEYAFAGVTYIYEGLVNAEELFGERGSRIGDDEVEEENMRYYKFSVPEDAATYFSFAPPSNPTLIGQNYVYFLFKTNPDGYDGSMLAVVADDYEFKIQKDAMIDIMVTDSQSGDGNAFAYEQYTVEECFEKEIMDYQGNIITKGMPVDVDVYFTPQGYVNHIYVYPNYGGFTFAEQVDAIQNNHPLMLQ